MKHINKKSIILAAFIMSVSQVSIADEKLNDNTYRHAEVDRLSVKLASDGTGIIKDFSCNGCGFKVLKVTAESRVYLAGVEIAAAELLQQSQAQVGIVRYALDSNTVYEIRFSH